MNNEEPNATPPYMDELSGRLLDAVEQIRSETPADAVLERALRRASQLETATRTTEVRSISPSLDSHRSRHMILRIAATVLAIAGFTGLWTKFTPAGAGIAFAQVQEAIGKVRSVTFDASSKSPGQPERKARVLILAPDRIRVEMPGGETLVHDEGVSKTLWIKTADKKAIVTEGQRPETSNLPADLYRSLRRIHAKAVERVPDKRIDGVTAHGFRVIDGQKTLQVWIDPATELPIRIESTRQLSDGVEIVEIATNFIFDSELDPSLFVTDPPAGYAIETRRYPTRLDPALQAGLILTAKVGLGPARFGMPKDEVLKVLGQPDQRRADETGGETLRYDTRGFWISFGTDGKVQAIACHAHRADAAPVAKTFAGKTSQGIAMCVNRESILKALGPANYLDERDSSFGQVTTMAYWDLGLEFSLRDDSLEEIHASLPKPPEM